MVKQLTCRHATCSSFPLGKALVGHCTDVPHSRCCPTLQVAYEHDEDFSSHIALLCHVSLLLVDHEEPLVAAAAQQLLVNCLYSLSARHLEIMQEEGHHVDCLQVCASPFEQLQLH